MNIEERKREASNIMRNKYTIWGRNVADVTLDCMVVDREYQRKQRRTVKDIAENFDPEQVGFLEVSYRDGLFHVIDGQHRLAAAKIIGLESLPCLIYEGLTLEEEALIFARQQNNVAKLTTFDIFKANICNGNRNIPQVNIDMTIKEICDEFEIPIVDYNDGLTALHYSRNIVKVNNDCFRWIMSLLHEAEWLSHNRKIGKVIVESLENCYKSSYNSQESYDALLYILSNYEISTIKTAANVAYPALRSERAFRNFLNDLSLGTATEADIVVLPQAS